MRRNHIYAIFVIADGNLNHIFFNTWFLHIIMNKEVYKTYKCETCEKWFMNKDELNIHTTSVHNKIVVE